VAEKPKSSVVMRDFPGLITNLDPDDLPPGSAQVQVNVTSSRPAVLEPRPGYRVVIFEDES
jgi:hypothetical protein